MSVTLESATASARPPTDRAAFASRRETLPGRLDPDRLADHLPAMYRAARGMCGSREDAEDLVQETVTNALRRPRWVQDGNEIAYLRRALQNTYASRYRAAQRRPATRPLLDPDAQALPTASITAREILQAIVSAPSSQRDAMIAVDLLGPSYAEAAALLATSKATLTTRLHRGRRRAAGQLTNDTTSAR